jgi:hypothetical protein
MKRIFVLAVLLAVGATLLPAPATAEDADLASVGLAMHGYYRVRFNNMFNLNWATRDDSNWWSYMDQRMLLDTTLLIGDPIQINTELDVLSNVMYGHNTVQVTPVVRTTRLPGAPEQIQRVQYDTLQFNTGNVFSESMTDTQRDRTDVAPILVRQLYANVNLPIGYLRFGRMATNFGLGVFYNSGTPFGRVGGRPDVNDLNGGFYADSGDVYDRILFGSRILGVWYPQIMYDRIAGNDFRSGKYDVHSFSLVNYVRDITFGDSGAFDAGLSISGRFQDATKAKLWIYDLYGRLAYGGFNWAGEAVFLQGAMTVVPFDTVRRLHDAGVPTGQGGGRIDTAAFLAVARFNYDAVRWGAGIEYGLSSPADANPDHEFSQTAADNVSQANAQAQTDPQDSATQVDFVDTVVHNQAAFGRRIKSYPFDPNYYVDLICWRLLMGGQVENGMYFRGGGFIRPLDGMYIDLYVINSYINEPYLGTNGRAASHSLGWESDVSFAYTFYKRFTAGFQTGYFFPGQYFTDVFGNAHNVFTLQMRTIVDF